MTVTARRVSDSPGSAGPTCSGTAGVRVVRIVHPSLGRGSKRQALRAACCLAVIALGSARGRGGSSRAGAGAPASVAREHRSWMVSVADQAA